MSEHLAILYIYAILAFAWASMTWRELGR